MNGTEPPAKRAKRTDSSAMWDMNEKPSRSTGRDASESDRSQKRELPTRDESKRATSTRDDRRRRSRSREDAGRRRDRSRSRDRARDGGRDRDGRRDRDRDRERDGRGGRTRDRSLSRERHRSRRDYPPSKSDRYHDRSRSPTRDERERKSRTRSPPPRSRAPRKEHTKEHRSRDDDRGLNGSIGSKQHTPRPKHQADEMDVDGEDEDNIDAHMRKAMGFSTFRSTQNTKVPGNQIYGVRKEKKTQYRQYMNRTGGFNRPLSPTRR